MCLVCAKIKFHFLFLLTSVIFALPVVEVMASREDRGFGVEWEWVESVSDEWCTDHELDDERDFGVTDCAPDRLESWVVVHLFRSFFRAHSARTDKKNVGSAMTTKRTIM